MGRLNRDTIAAIFLLLLCGVFFWASFDIRQPDYGTLPPSTWPRIILGVLSVLSLVYLIQSLRQGSAETDRDRGAAPEERAPGFTGWISYWRNPLYCFALFFLFLLSLPVLGMLIGGISFVFLLLGMLGGWGRQSVLVHAAVAIVTVGAMWSLFTFGLGVILPTGMIFNPFS